MRWILQKGVWQHNCESEPEFCLPKASEASEESDPNFNLKKTARCKIFSFENSVKQFKKKYQTKN